MRTISYLAVAVLTAAVTYGIAQVNQPLKAPARAEKSVPDIGEAEAEKSFPAPKPPAAALPGDEDDISPEERINIKIYQQVNRSVVFITTRSLEADDLFFFATPRKGSGSGSVLDENGHLITNYHGVENASQIMVTLYDGSNYSAKLIGSDPNNELAVLKITAPADKLHPIQWGDSSKLLVGMRVLAIGNPFGLERTLTTGIVSSLNRSLTSDNNRKIRGIIQTDAAINPGNSGGPLLNRKGEMIGITTAIVSRAGQSAGIGLAIPANTARRVVHELVRYGRVIRPDCGIFSVYETDKGLLIAQLDPEGPAQKAGLRGPQENTVRRGGFVFRSLDRSKADMIVAVDGKPVNSLEDLLSHVESKKPGDQVVLQIIRENESLEISVVLEENRSR